MTLVKIGHFWHFVSGPGPKCKGIGLYFRILIGAGPRAFCGSGKVLNGISAKMPLKGIFWPISVET